MGKICKAVLCVAAVGIHWAAQAQIYICKDASGRTLTSDRPIPECAKEPMREMGRDGVVRRVIPAPLTTEQRRQQELDAEKEKAAAVAAETQKQADKAMLMRYRNENDIVVTHKRVIDGIQEKIKREKLSLADAEKQLKTAQAEAEFHKGKPKMPVAVQRKLDEATQAVQSSKGIIADREAEIVQLDAKHEETVRRFRQLTTGAGTDK